MDIRGKYIHIIKFNGDTDSSKGVICSGYDKMGHNLYSFHNYIMLDDTNATSDDMASICKHVKSQDQIFYPCEIDTETLLEYDGVGIKIADVT